MSLDRIYSVNDLNVLLDPKLIFDSQIDRSSVYKAMSVLAFIKHWSKKFDDAYDQVECT